MDPNNNDSRCFQFAATIALNHESIEVRRERIAKIMPFIHQYNWNKINFSIGPSDWEKCETNNKLIHLKVLFIEGNTKK